MTKKLNCSNILHIEQAVQEHQEGIYLSMPKNMEDIPACGKNTIILNYRQGWPTVFQETNF